MKKVTLTAIVGLLVSTLLCSGLLAQSPGNSSTRISGTVASATTGEKISGATIILASDRKTATTTNADGAFTLNLPAGITSAELLVSHVGFEKKQVSVTAGQTEISILLNDASSLNEVVVTALGIKKDKKALAYALTEVKGEEFTQAREINIANALTGKIAGVNSSSLASGPGGSSRVIIRGNGSFSGNNQPLYVINGMPIDNSTLSAPVSGNGAIGLNNDRGDGIAGINPDDIESITVLKGGTAAALYGSLAANGVILITTKRGAKQKGIGVEYNTTFTMDTPAVLPEWQYEFGAGQFAAKPTTQSEAINMGRLSFGTRMDGSDVIQFDGVRRPYSPQKDNIRNFYKTGTTFTNTVAFLGGNESATWRASLSDMNNHGQVPNQKLNKKIFSFALNSNLGKKVVLEAYGQYNIEKAENRSGVADAPGNPNWGTYMIANTVDVRSLKPGYDGNDNEILWNPSGFASNPWFVVNKFRNHDNRNRFIGNLGIRYNILDNLYIKGRVTHDYSNINYTGVVPSGNAYAPKGIYQQYTTGITETNADLTLNYNTRFAGDFTLNVLAGGNQRRSRSETVNLDGVEFGEPGFYDPSNVKSLTTTTALGRSRTNSVFGAIDLSYRDMLYLTATGRSDWFSTLSPKDNNIFYPSVGVSFILSEAFQMPNWVTYAKLRSSWAQVGGGTPIPYALNLTYSLIPGGGHFGQGLQQVTNVNGSNSGQTMAPNENLKPYTSTTTEIGLEARFLNGRISTDIALYHRKTTDDIVQANISPGSGYNFALVNAGEMTNKGIEVMISGTPIKTKDFNWEVSFNAAYNENKVVKILDNLKSFPLAASVNNYAYIYLEEGLPYSTIKGFRVKKDAKGNTVFGANGYEASSELVDLGTGVAPFTTGITNTFNYKRFGFSFLIDGKFGGHVYSATNLYATRFGLHKMTLPGRDNGLTVTGVDNTGAPVNKTFTPAQLQGYYDNFKNLSEKFVYDADFIKLRQVILSYQLPVQGLSFVKIQSATISFVARNLLFLHKKADNIDPESTFNNTGAQGFEMFGVPKTRSYGVNLLVKF